MKAFYNENDPCAAAWLRELISGGHIAPGVVDERDIRDLKGDDLAGFTQVHLFAGVAGWSRALRLAGWSDSRPVWTGSCPCQPISGNGYMHGERDARHLWPEFHRLIAQCRPPICLGEQVASGDGVEWVDDVALDLEDLGYAFGAADLPAASVGADHCRQRLWWVAYAPGERQPQPGLRRQDTGHYPASEFREANRLVDAVRRGDLPFLCRSHDGLPARVDRVAGKGYGNAIVAQVAAEFIVACEDAREAVTA